MVQFAKYGPNAERTYVINFSLALIRSLSLFFFYSFHHKFGLIDIEMDLIVFCLLCLCFYVFMHHAWLF